MQNKIFVSCKSSYKLTVSARLLFHPINRYLIDNICSRGDIDSFMIIEHIYIEKVTNFYIYNLAKYKMIISFFIPFIISHDMPNYRTKFFNQIPSDFDSSKFSRSFEYNLGDSIYKCYIAENQTPKTKETPEEYLKSILLGNCFQMTHTDYWYYTFCPFKSLSQFRYADDKVTHIDTFTLGKESHGKYEIIDRGIATNWTNGDICAVNKKPRKTRVEFICDMSRDDDGSVTSISEPSFCHYLVKFHTQHACAFPNITNENLYQINCYLQARNI